MRRQNQTPTWARIKKYFRLDYVAPKDIETKIQPKQRIHIWIYQPSWIGCESGMWEARMKSNWYFFPTMSWGLFR